MNSIEDLPQPKNPNGGKVTQFNDTLDHFPRVCVYKFAKAQWFGDTFISLAIPKILKSGSPSQGYVVGVGCCPRVVPF